MTEVKEFDKSIAAHKALQHHIHSTEVFERRIDYCLTSHSLVPMYLPYCLFRHS